MARLYRPHIPLEVRCRVALRQLGSDPERIERRLLSEHHHSGGDGYAKFLERLLADLARELGCEVKDLRLDHDPALCNRPQERRGLGRKTYYFPDANDPDHLLYRSSHAHDIKTRVRGDGAQHSDLALRRIAKRRERKASRGKLSTNRLAKPAKRRDKKSWPKRPMPKGRGFPTRRG